MAPIAELTKNEHKCDYCGYDERYVEGSHVDYMMYGWDKGEAKIKGVQNYTNNGGFITIQGDNKVAKRQEAYISPTITKELPKKKLNE